MNIDERLEKLGEHIDALAQSVELLASFHRDTELRLNEFIERVDAYIARTGARMANMDDRMAGMDDRFAKMMDTFNRLGNIVISHDELIDKLEGN
jgi:hypothetical protein